MRVFIIICFCLIPIESYANEIYWFMGDSITMSEYPDEVGNVSSSFYDKEIDIVKIGGNGWVTGAIENEFTKRFRDTDDKNRPDVIVWYSGINDCVSIGNIKELKESMFNVVNMVRRNNILFVIIKHYNWFGKNNKYKSCALSANDYFDAISKVFDNVIIVDTMRLLGKDGLKSCYNSGDGVHLSHNGYIELSHLIYETIKFYRL